MQKKRALEFQSNILRGTAGALGSTQLNMLQLQVWHLRLVD